MVYNGSGPQLSGKQRACVWIDGNHIHPPLLPLLLLLVQFHEASAWKPPCWRLMALTWCTSWSLPTARGNATRVRTSASCTVGQQCCPPMYWTGEINLGSLSLTKEPWGIQTELIYERGQAKTETFLYFPINTPIWKWASCLCGGWSGCVGGGGCIYPAPFDDVALFFGTVFFFT